jgi:hypothetical protein
MAYVSYTGYILSSKKRRIFVADPFTTVPPAPQAHVTDPLRRRYGDGLWHGNRGRTGRG